MPDVHEHGEILRAQALDQRHHGEHFADAGAVHPDQRAVRPRRRRFAAPLGAAAPDVPCRAAAAAPAAAARAALRQPMRTDRRAKPAAGEAGTLNSPPRLIDKFVGPPRRRIQALLEQAARRFKRRFVGIGRHADRLRRDAGATAERQVDRGAVPVIEHEAPAGGDRARIDRAARGLRQLDDAQPGDARDFRARRPTARSSALGQRIEHRLKGGDAGLMHEAAAVIAGAADGADAEPLARQQR